MYAGLLVILLYVLCILVGIAFMVFLIVALNKLLNMKQQQNELLRELIQILKENKPLKE